MEWNGMENFNMEHGIVEVWIEMEKFFMLSYVYFPYLFILRQFRY